MRKDALVIVAPGGSGMDIACRHGLGNALMRMAFNELALRARMTT